MKHDETKIYLITWEGVDRIRDIPEEYLAYAHSFAPRHADLPVDYPAWATAETLDGLDAIDADYDILDERPLLPTLHSFFRHVETEGWDGILSCIAIAEWGDADSEALPRAIVWLGTDLQGVGFFGGYHIFMFGVQEHQQYNWLAICDGADYRLAKIVYKDNRDALSWLERIAGDLEVD